MANLNIVIKSYLEMPVLSVETRRFVVERASIDKDGIYDQVHGKVGYTFPDLKGKKFTLFWKDDDDDFVTVSTDEEIRDLLSNEVNGMCRIYIKVCGDEEEPMKTPEQDHNLSTAGKGDHDKVDPLIDMMPPPPVPHGRVFSAPLPPPPPPPPPFFGFHGQHPHKMFVGPFGGPFNGPSGWRRGSGRHQHHPHHFHPRMHHLHHHGLGGHHPYGGFHWGHHWGMHGGRHGHKDSLRTLVPMPHRRWAKGFIQSWRKENLKNATTTTSDSDGNFDWKISMTDAGVPKAYADWLEIKLLRWHKKWSCDEVDEVSGEGNFNKMEKKADKALKVSVPKEFRQWTKRYLNTHFGRRDAPKLNKRHCGNGWNGEMFKKHTLCATVPKEYRMWTQNFIRKWRIERNLDDSKSTIPLTNNEKCETMTDANETFSIPEEYKYWLGIFLFRWHVWRGLLERDPDVPMRGGMGQFKGSVPLEYRAWVKYYMVEHYSKNKKSDRCSEVEVEPSQRKYAKMLQAFQKKWLEKQQALGEDSDPMLYMSSTDEETSKGEPEASFERLSLNNDNGCKKSRVRFDDQSDKAKKLKTMLEKEDAALEIDSDDMDDEVMPQTRVPVDPKFRPWAKQALFKWDGETVEATSSSPQDCEEEMQLPPHIYNWMSKMMIKMQMKKMKQQFKAAKREMKVAKKQQKYAVN